MDIKLTLKLDDRVIQRAKAYASSRNVSLSRIVESYLMSITGQNSTEEEDIRITPFVKSISSNISLPADIDHKSEYRDYLDKKYS